MGAALPLLEEAVESGLPLPALWRADHGRLMSAAAGSLGQQLAEAWSDGRRLPADQALALAFGARAP